MKRVKIFSIVSVALALLLVAGACTSGAPGAAPPDASSGAAAGEQAAPSPEGGDGAVTVTFSRWASGTEQNDFDNWLQSYTAENPHVTIVSNYLPYHDYFTKLRADLIANNAADVIAVEYSNWFGIARSDVFEDLSSFSGADGVIASLAASGVEAYQVDGRQVGLPIGVGSRTLYYNANLFNQAGVGLPSQTVAMTTTELVEKMEQLKDALGDDYMSAHLYAFEMMHGLAATVNAPIVSGDGKTVLANNPESIKAITEWQKIMQARGKVPIEQELEGPWASFDAALATGRVAMNWTGNWSHQGMEDAGINYFSIPAPYVPGGRPMQEAYINGLCIPKTSAVQEAAWDLIQWMLSEEPQLAFGKFSDAPANTAASARFREEQNAENPNAFGGYVAVTATNSWFIPPTGTEFTALILGLQFELEEGVITPEQFAQQLEERGQPLLDDFQANLS